MIINVIVMWMLVVAIPLWIYRWVAYFRLNAGERRIFKRLTFYRKESAVGFATRIFAYLAILAIALLMLAFGMRYLKYGTFEIPAYKALFRSRFYSGFEKLDHTLDAYHYDQALPVAVLTVSLLLSVAFSLIAVSFRDISTIRRIRCRLKSLKEHSNSRTD